MLTSAVLCMMLLLLDCAKKASSILLKIYSIIVCSDGLHVNVRSYNAMINGLCWEGLLDEARDLMRKMEQNGFSPENFA